MLTSLSALVLLVGLVFGSPPAVAATPGELAGYLAALAGFHGAGPATLLSLYVRPSTSTRRWALAVGVGLTNLCLAALGLSLLTLAPIYRSPEAVIACILVAAIVTGVAAMQAVAGLRRLFTRPTIMAVAGDHPMPPPASHSRRYDVRMNRKLLVALALILTAIFALTVWPTLYRYDTVRYHQVELLIKTNRVTGASWMLAYGAWERVPVHGAPEPR